MCTDNVDDLLEDETELDDEGFRLVDDRTLKVIVATIDTEQIFKQPFLVRSLHRF